MHLTGKHLLIDWLWIRCLVGISREEKGIDLVFKGIVNAFCQGLNKILKSDNLLLEIIHHNVVIFNDTSDLEFLDATI